MSLPRGVSRWGLCAISFLISPLPGAQGSRPLARYIYSNYWRTQRRRRAGAPTEDRAASRYHTTHQLRARAAEGRTEGRARAAWAVQATGGGVRAAAHTHTARAQRNTASQVSAARSCTRAEPLPVERVPTVSVDIASHTPVRRGHPVCVRACGGHSAATKAPVCARSAWLGSSPPGF